MNGFVNNIPVRGPIEYFFEVEEITDDMIQWLNNIQDSETIVSVHHPLKLEFGKIFFYPGYKKIATMFLLKYKENIVSHNLGDI